MLKLSVLDQSIALHGHGEGEAIRDTLAMAQHCEALGYHRFWVSEHHGHETIVGTAPEIMVAAIAARTQRIRVGSAGVMLPHYSAYKVAEQFRVLESIAPGRIDLGLGRAPAGNMQVALALNPNAMANMMSDRFPGQVQDVRAWVAGREHRSIVAHPRPAADATETTVEAGTVGPDIWLLGASDAGAKLAAKQGLPFAFAYFFMDGKGVESALEIYRAEYRPSPGHPTPRTSICVWALAADTEAEARHHTLSYERWRLDPVRNVFGPLRSADSVAAEGFSDSELPALGVSRANDFVGTGGQVADQLRALAARLQLDELVVTTGAYDRVARRRSYTLLAEAFGLDGERAAATPAHAPATA